MQHSEFAYETLSTFAIDLKITIFYPIINLFLQFPQKEQIGQNRAANCWLLGPFLYGSPLIFLATVG